MELSNEKLAKANQCISIADHMLSVTYPLLKDPKLLIAVVENIFLGYANSIAALLFYERSFKRIPAFNESSFESKMNMFRERCVGRYDLDKGYLIEIQIIRDIIMEHKKSPVEFKRNDSFVICSENYKIKTVNSKDIKQYLDKAKVFIGEINNIFGKNGRL